MRSSSLAKATRSVVLVAFHEGDVLLLHDLLGLEPGFQIDVFLSHVLPFDASRKLSCAMFSKRSIKEEKPFAGTFTINVPPFSRWTGFR